MQPSTDGVSPSAASKPRILVCGGRDFQDRGLLDRTLTNLCNVADWRWPSDEYGNWLPNVHIIAGKAKGADTMAVDWAVVNWCEFTEFPADWNKHGKKAGFLRNRQMLEEGKPDIVVAFPGGHGTRMMIDIAKKAGVEVYEVGVHQ